MARLFGTPDGIKVGQLFIDRRDLHEHFVHRPTQAGISGTKIEGENGSLKHTKDQSPEAPGNAGLITSWVSGLPVRVVRGSHPSSPYAPRKGYQYAGLFVVTEYWVEAGVDGFLVLRFRLDRLSEQAELVTREPAEPDPAFATSTVTRRIRDTALSREVKAMYSHRCQVCQTSIPGLGQRLYSEGAHVKPLGRPHLGADALDNILCLCPNHHTQLDIGGLVILDDFSVARTTDYKPFTALSFAKDHHIQISNAAYHRKMWSPA